MKMKRIAALLLALLMSLTFAACSKGGAAVTTTAYKSTTTTTASSTTTTTTTSAASTTTTTATTTTTTAPPTTTTAAPAIAEDGEYYSKEDVALYIHTYGHLPSNYISKKDAQALGWTGGSLEPYAPGKVIGGSYFGNYEGKLPEKSGREYHECDIIKKGAKSRGAKRLVYSNDGLIYYTDDHYETFTLLYGEE